MTNRHWHCGRLGYVVSPSPPKSLTDESSNHPYTNPLSGWLEGSHTHTHLAKFNSICLLSHARGKAQPLRLHSYLVMSWFIRRSRVLLRQNEAELMHIICNKWILPGQRARGTYNIHEAWGVYGKVCMQVCKVEAMPAAMSHTLSHSEGLHIDSQWGLNLLYRGRFASFPLFCFLSITSLCLSLSSHNSISTTPNSQVRIHFLCVFFSADFCEWWWEVCLGGGQQL